MFPDVKIAHKSELGFPQIYRSGEKDNVPAKKADRSDVTNQQEP